MSANNQSAMGTSLPDGLVFITDGSASGLQIWKNKWIAFVDTEALSLKNLNDLDGLATTKPPIRH
jgi:hypothetical protein